MEKIVVFSTTAIGDTLLSTPVFAALRQEFPDAVIKVVVQEKFIPLFAGNPHVNGFIGWKKGLFSFWQMVKELQQNQFQLALLLHVSDPFPVYMTAFAGIPKVAGYSPDKNMSCFFTHVVQPPGGKHVIFHRLAVLEAVHVDHDDWSTKMVLPVAPQASAIISRQYKKACFLNPDNSIIVGFQPGASKEFKMWPVESFIALGKKLLGYHSDIVIVILGSQSEKKRCKKIAQGIDFDDRVVSLCGFLPLEDLPSLVTSLRCLVTNDTGTMHIAIAIKTPTVSLFVPTSPVGIGPIQDSDLHCVLSRPRPCGDKCVTKQCSETPSCMALLPVEEVFSATLTSLGL